MWRPFFILGTVILLSNVQNTGSQDNNTDDNAQNLSGAKKSLKVIEGVNAKPHSHPSIVLMTFGKSPICGGSILNDEWVLSAARCVGDTNPKQYGFLEERHDKSKPEASEQRVSVSKVIVHEGFGQTDDIALFQVSPKFKFNDKVKAVVLPTGNWNLQTGNVLVVGWGKNLPHSNSSSNILQQAWLPVVNNEECQTLMRLTDFTNICAGFVQGGKDSCKGDSGGPLYFKANSSMFQVGIASWGDGCAKKGKVGVNTRVSKYIDWIKSKTGGKVG